MSVYTEISKTQLEKFLQAYTLGELINFQGIEAGIENTNYYVITTDGEYVLTLFETLKAKKIPFFLDLITYLTTQNISCSSIQRDADGNAINTLARKPAVLFKYLPGKSITTPKISDCTKIGHQLAQLHLATKDFPQKINNSMGLNWFRRISKKLQPHLTDQEKLLIQQQLKLHKLFPLRKLPKGIIHGDLFPDNVLFSKNKISGVLDFYLACYDSYVLDLAITVNAWSYNNGVFEIAKANALIKSYQQYRPLNRMEKNSWSTVLQIAATKFWLARLDNQFFPRNATLTTDKDPEDYKKILIHHLNIQIRI